MFFHINIEVPKEAALIQNTEDYEILSHIRDNVR